MRTIRFAVVTAIAMIAAAPQARATLLVYEGFNYTTGTASGSGVLLNGQSGGTGLTGSWATTNNGTANSVTVYQEGNLSGVNFNTGAANQFDGTVSNLTTSGGYFGSVGLGGTANTTDHIYAHRSLDPTVTATFTHGSTTWFSFVTARAYNANASAPKLSIGADILTGDRGHTSGGEGIGVGGGIQSNLSLIHAHYWNENPDTGNSFTDHNPNGPVDGSGAAFNPAVPVADRFYWEMGSTSGTTTITTGSAFANIIIAKIVWSDTGPDVISFARFLETDTLTEANFDAIDISTAGWATQANLDQSQFDTISIAGGRYFMDEIRIATTFNEVIGLTAVTAVPAPAALPAGLALLALAAARRRRA